MNIFEESSLTLLLCLRIIFQSTALKSAECKTVCAEGTMDILTRQTALQGTNRNKTIFN